MVSKMDDEQKVGPNEEVLGDKRMQQAYEASSELLRRRLSKEGPDDVEILKEVKESDIIIIEGCYDHAQVNFKMAEVPHTVISPSEVESLEINANQLLFINCPGTGISDSGIKRIQQFVETGGMLVTTDWVLRNVLEKMYIINF